MKRTSCKLLATLLTLLMLVTMVLPFSVSAEETFLTPTEGAPKDAPLGAVGISTVEEFEQMDKNGVYFLKNDIDFGGKVYDNYILAEFSGYLDGCGHKIFNYALKDTKGSDVGTFYRTAYTGNTTIRNLQYGTAEQPIKLTASKDGSSSGTVAANQSNNNLQAVFDNLTIYVDLVFDGTGRQNVGGVVGYSRRLMVTNTTVYGTLKATSVNSNKYRNLAGFVGSANQASLYFNNCVNYANIELAAGTKEARAAGFIGYTAQGFTMKNCANFGTISSYADPTEGVTLDMQAGGLVCQYAGNATVTATLKNCFNAGSVKGVTYAGGLCGDVTKADAKVNASQCYNYGTVQSTANGGGLCGKIASGATFQATECEDRVGQTAPTAVTPASEPAVAVSNVEEFLAMDSNPGNYYLANDIDFGGKTYQNCLLKDFSGILDGKGHTLYNYSIVSEADGTTEFDCGTFQSVALNGHTSIQNITFGKADQKITLLTTAGNSKAAGVAIGRQGNVYSVKLENVTVYGTVSRIAPSSSTDQGMVAGIAGFLRVSDIRNCTMYGSVTDGTPDITNLKYKNAAGVIGTIQGGAFLDNVVNYADVTAYPSAVEPRAAGITTFISNAIFMQNCKNYGNCTAYSAQGSAVSQAAGMICDSNHAHASIFINCVNEGTLTGDLYCAAVLGYARSDSQVQRVLLSNCYNKGKLNAPLNNSVFVGISSGLTTAPVEIACVDLYSETPVEPEESEPEKPEPEEPGFDTPETGDNSFFAAVFFTCLILSAFSAGLLLKREKSLKKSDSE